MAAFRQIESVGAFVSLIMTSILSVPFWFGFFIIFYVAVVGPVKVVDVFGVLFILYAFHKGVVFSLEFCLLLLVVMVLLGSTLLAPSHVVDMAGVLVLFLNSFFSVLVFVCVSSLKTIDIRLFLRGFIISFLLVGVLSLLGLITAGSVGFSPYLSVTGFSIIGTMPDPSRFGLAVTVFILLVYTRWMFEKKSYFWAFSLVLGFFFLMANGQRAAFLFSSIGLILGVGLSLFYFVKQVVSTGRLNRKYILAAGVFLALLLALDMSDFGSIATTEHRVLKKLESSGSSYFEDPRYMKFLSGVELLSQGPFIGFGFDAYNRLSGAGTSHNSYIEIAVAGGIVALGLYLIFLLCVVCRCFHSLRQAWGIDKCFEFKWLAVFRFSLTCVFFLYFFVINIQFMVFAYAFLGLCSNPNLADRSLEEAGRA